MRPGEIISTIIVVSCATVMLCIPSAVRAQDDSGYVCPYPKTVEEKQIRCRYIVSTLAVLEGWQNARPQGDQQSAATTDLLAIWKPVSDDCLNGFFEHDETSLQECARDETARTGCLQPAVDFLRVSESYPSALQFCPDYWPENMQECATWMNNAYHSAFSFFAGELESAIINRLEALRQEYPAVCDDQGSACPATDPANPQRIPSVTCSDMYRGGMMKGIFGTSPNCFTEDVCYPGEPPTPCQEGGEFCSVTPAATASPATTPEETETPEGTVTPEQSMTPGFSPTPDMTATARVTRTPRITISPTPTPRFSVTPAASRSPTPFFTRTSLPTNTPGLTPTVISSATATRSATPTVRVSVSATPTRSPFATFTPTITITPTRSVTPALTGTPLRSATPTRTPAVVF